MAGATRDHKFSVAAGGRQDVSGPITFIKLVSANGTIRLDIDGNVSDFTQGKHLELEEPIKGFSIQNDSGSTISGTFELGIRAKTGDSNLSGTVGLTKATTPDSVADVSLLATTTTVIAAADATRRTLIVSNPATNTQTFRIGDATAAAANGIPLAPGETLVLDTSGAISGYNPGAVAESVAVMALKD